MTLLKYRTLTLSVVSLLVLAAMALPAQGQTLGLNATGASSGGAGASAGSAGLPGNTRAGIGFGSGMQTHNNASMSATENSAMWEYRSDTQASGNAGVYAETEADDRAAYTVERQRANVEHRVENTGERASKTVSRPTAQGHLEVGVR